jgi:hypothetical protein
MSKNLYTAKVINKRIFNDGAGNTSMLAEIVGCNGSAMVSKHSNINLDPKRAATHNGKGLEKGALLSFEADGIKAWDPETDKLIQGNGRYPQDLKVQKLVGFDPDSVKVVKGVFLDEMEPLEVNPEGPLADVLAQARDSAFKSLSNKVQA